MPLAIGLVFQDHLAVNYMSTDRLGCLRYCGTTRIIWNCFIIGQQE